MPAAIVSFGESLVPGLLSFPVNATYTAVDGFTAFVPMKACLPALVPVVLLTTGSDAVAPV
jgi:hypothetical protein